MRKEKTLLEKNAHGTGISSFYAGLAIAIMGLVGLFLVIIEAMPYSSAIISLLLTASGILISLGGRKIQQLRANTYQNQYKGLLYQAIGFILFIITLALIIVFGQVSVSG